MNTSTLSHTAQGTGIRSLKASAADCLAGHPEVRLRLVAPAEYETHAARFVDVVQEQTAGFVASRWGDDRTECVLIERHGEVIAGAAVMVARVPVIDAAMAIVKWGPLWRLRGRKTDPEILGTALQALDDEYVKRRGYHLTFIPHADPEWSTHLVTLLEKRGYQAGEELNSPARYLVNVDCTEEDLRSSLSQKWRYNLKKAHGVGFDIRAVPAEDGIERFMALYRQMLARKQFNDTSAIRTLNDRLCTAVEDLRPMLVMVSHDGSDTAGAMIDTCGERAVYLYGATDDRALPLRAGYALHWWIARLLCARPETRWYDLGGDDGDHGLMQFKKGFVGKTGAIEMSPPAYTRCTSLRSAATGKAVYALRSLRSKISNLRNGIPGR